MDLGIAGKRVLITGGSRGIGAATARAFAAEGCKLTLVARDEGKLQQLLQEIGTEWHSYVAADLLEHGEALRVAQHLLAAHGTYDIVVHNLGGALGVKDPLAAVEDWNRVWLFNAGVAIAINRTLVPPMRQQRWGRIVHVSSISGEIGEPLAEPYGGAIPYAAAKAYLNAYVRGLGRELARDNIVVSAVMPGALLIEGKYWKKLTESNAELVNTFLREHHPTGRFGRAEEIAPFVVFLASQQASFACGALVPVDGGRM